MQRSLGWVACLVLAACTQIADFDRSKIPDDDSRVDGGGGDGDGDGDMNEAGPGDGDMDAQVPGMDAATDAGVDGKVPPVCDVLTHAGCGSEQLCCDMGEGPICIDTSIDQCTVCDGKSDAGVPGPGACDTEVALSCVGRTCVCDTTTGMACSGLDQGSVCDPNTNTCIGCRSSGDCQGLPDRKTCLDGVCVECDPANNTCQGAEPICNANKECEPCNTTANNCPSPLECTAAGCVGCDPADDSGCGGSTPQCNPNGLMCVGCLVSDDCTMDPAKPICSGANVCVSCTSNEQCDARDPGTSAPRRARATASAAAATPPTTTAARTTWQAPTSATPPRSPAWTASPELDARAARCASTAATPACSAT